MQTGKSSVKDIFDGTRILNVPTYQRAYSWEREANLQDFLNDLLSQQPQRPYFFGSFLLHLKESRNEFAVVDIVDGQQRLTTLVIFMHVLLGRLIAEKSTLVSERTRRIFVRDGDVFKLESANEGHAFLHGRVLCEKMNTEGDVTLTTHSQRLLLDARQFFEEKLATLDRSTLEAIYTTAANADVLLYVVDDISTATQIFELLNDRGRRLTPLESIKSFLMYNAGIVHQCPEQSIGKIQEDFAAIYRLIECHKMKDSDVLRYHMLAFEKYPTEYGEKPKAYIKEKVLRLVRQPATHAEAAKVIDEYSSRLRNSFELFGKIQELRFTDQALANTYMIGRVAPFYPAMMNVLEHRPDEFRRLVKAINAFTLRAALAALRSNGESYQATCLRNDEDVIALIEKFIVGDGWWNLNVRVQSALSWSNHYEYLDTNVVRYLLVSYENFLRKKEGYPLISLQDYVSKDPRARLSIEHITAQRAENLAFNARFKEHCLQNIGNLVIDHAAPNSRKGRKSGDDKSVHYAKAPLMSQNEITTIKCDWKKVESIKGFIDEREDKLKSFIAAEFGLTSD